MPTLFSNTTSILLVPMSQMLYSYPEWGTYIVKNSTYIVLIPKTKSPNKSQKGYDCLGDHKLCAQQMQR